MDSRACNKEEMDRNVNQNNHATELLLFIQLLNFQAFPIYHIISIDLAS